MIDFVKFVEKIVPGGIDPTEKALVAAILEVAPNATMGSLRQYGQEGAGLLNDEQSYSRRLANTFLDEEEFAKIKQSIELDKALLSLSKDHFATSEMNSAQLKQAFIDKLERIVEDLGLTEENTKVVADQFRTTSTFLDESSNLIGRGIESMLGMNEEGGTKSIVEALQIANEQRETQMNQKQDNSSPHSSKS